MSHLASTDDSSEQHLWAIWLALMNHVASTDELSGQQRCVTGQHWWVIWPPQISHDSGWSTLINYLASTGEPSNQQWWTTWLALMGHLVPLIPWIAMDISPYPTKQYGRWSYKPFVVWNLFSLLNVIPWYRRDGHIWCYWSSSSSGCNASCLGQWRVSKARHHGLLNLSTTWKL